MAEARGDSLRVAQSYSLLARCEFQSGEFEAARFLLEESRLRYHRAGARWGLATSANMVGELARATGDLETAEASYSEAAERFDACGSGDGVFARLNLGLTLAERGKPGRSLRQLDQVGQELKKGGRTAVLTALHVIRLFPLGSLGRWRRVANELDEAEEALKVAGMIDVDLAQFAVYAAALCDDKGRPKLARRIWKIAHDQWTAMGRDELAAEAAAHL